MTIENSYLASLKQTKKHSFRIIVLGKAVNADDGMDWELKFLVDLLLFAEGNYIDVLKQKLYMLLYKDT